MKIKGKVINRRDYRRGRLITRWWLSVSPSEILRVPEGPTVSKALFSNPVGLVELALSPHIVTAVYIAGYHLDRRYMTYINTRS